MKFSVYQVSRQGGRDKNEDRMGYCYTRDAGLFALADGMGGHPEGEVASQLALQTLSALFQRDARPRLADPKGFLLQAITAAHQELIRYAARKGMTDTPRTTVVACVLQEGAAHWAHCGDSRLYLVRADTLVARTRDHSYAELQQTLALASANLEPVNRNVLFTCLGSPGEPVIDSTGPVGLHRGDRILLCSDGLWDNLDDERITARLTTGSLAEGVPGLVDQALREGGATCDNVTALALEWEGAADAAQAVPIQALGKARFASTIQASVDAGSVDSDDVDEAEIQRAIREINAAIQRSSGRKP